MNETNKILTLATVAALLVLTVKRPKVGLGIVTAFIIYSAIKMNLENEETDR